METGYEGEKERGYFWIYVQNRIEVNRPW